ncbi:hypothetical protein GCM10010455_04110 [Microbacterium esteraromaticum]
MADAVADRDQGIRSLGRSLCDAMQSGLGVRVRGVLEGDDGVRRIRIVVAHATDEGRDGAGGRAVDGGDVLVERQGLLGDASEADGHR